MRAAIYEIRAICEDFRMQVIGGAQGAFDLWNSCVIPSLLYNCSVWTGIKKSEIRILDNLQHEMIRVILRIPSSTPLPALRGATGLMGMEWRIWKEKLLLIHSIKKTKDSCLANQILEEQIALGFPGPAEEATEICRIVGLPDICTEEVGIRDIKSGIHNHHLKMLEKEMQSLKKCNMLISTDLKKPQPYLTNSCLEETRMSFRLQCQMLDIPGDMKTKYKGRTECQDCLPWGLQDEDSPNITQEHLMECPAYSNLRTGRDLENNMRDKTQYFMDVMKIMKARK